MQAPFFAVPFVVLVHVNAVENARFYLSWGVMAVVYVSIQMIGQALLVEGGRGGADHRRQAAVAMGVGLAVAASATVLSLGLGPLLAGLYGPDYGPVATLLPLLMAGTIPFAVTMTMLTTARIREHSHSTIAVAVAFAVAVLVPTVLLVAQPWRAGRRLGLDDRQRDRRGARAPCLSSARASERGAGADSGGGRHIADCADSRLTRRRAGEATASTRSRRRSRTHRRGRAARRPRAPRAPSGRGSTRPQRVAAPASGPGEVPSRS